MATLAQLETYTQLLINDQGARAFSAAQLDLFINRALEEWVNETEELWRHWAVDVVAKQMFYTAPTDMIRPIAAWYGPLSNAPLSVVNEHEYLQEGGFHFSQGAGNPNYLVVDRQGTAPVFQVWPPPSATSATTTLSSGINSSVATIPVAATSSFRTPGGWIKINSEKMIYQNTDSTNFLLARRGEAGTTAASHSSSDTVTALDLMVLYARHATALSASGDIPEINLQNHYNLAYGAACKALEADGRSPNYYTSIWLEALKRGKREVSRRRAASPNLILQEGY